MMIYFWVSIHPAKLLKASLRENKEQTVTQKPDHELGLYQSGQLWSVSSVGRAGGLHPSGREFEPLIDYYKTGQMVAAICKE